MAQDGKFEFLRDQFRDWRWRLSNLYYITDKNGKRIKFEPNWAQQELMSNMHFMNLILKARQLGCTTFLQLFMLDEVIFNSNVRAGTIAHNLKDVAAIFQDKIKYPYTQLPQGIRDARPQIRDSASELALSNNSSIRVGTSLRSGTFNFLHISEYGKLCAKYPEKAREVRTGALNTVQSGQWIAIESTAEGQDGDFFNVCQTAQSLHRRGTPLTPLDFKFFFFPWWKDDSYQIDPTDVIIPSEMNDYFSDLELKHGVTLTQGQKAWYVKKAASQLGDMKREYPATAEEAFAASVEGAYYGDLIAKAESEGRIGEFKVADGIPVHTSWDIGRHDATAIWFWQRLLGEIRHVGYYENSGEGMPFYAEKVKELYGRNGWQREGAIDYVPHDARVVEWGTKRSRVEQMIAHQLNPRIPTALSLHDGINAVRAIIPISTYDTENCSQGIAVLKNYRKDWNEAGGMWSKSPCHNWASHGADAERILACAHRDLQEPKPEEKQKSNLNLGTIRDEMLREATDTRNYR